jgi:hypothetical protein
MRLCDKSSLGSVHNGRIIYPGDHAAWLKAKLKCGSETVIGNECGINVGRRREFHSRSRELHYPIKTPDPQNLVHILANT